MGQEDALFTKALSADVVLNGLCNVAKDGFAAENVNLEVYTSIPGLHTSVNGRSDIIEQHADLRTFAAAVKPRPSLLCQKAVVRLSGNDDASIHYTLTPDSLVGQFRLRSIGNAGRATKFFDAVSKHFTASTYLDIVRSAAPEAERAAISMRERSVSDLQESLRKMEEFLVDSHKRESEFRRTLQSELEASHKERSDALEKEYRDRQAALDKRKETLEDADSKREKLFQERVAEFETKESKYVRRELLKQTLAVVRELETMSLSSATGNKRRWIHGFTWLLIAASGSLAGFAATRVLQADQPDWHYLALLSGSFITFVFTLVYYLKWNDRWFREHADGEFSAKRYKADMLRASWVAELIQEWAQQGRGDLPPELLTAFTRSIFRDAGPSQVSEHPVDDITALIKRATRVDIGKGIFSVTASPAIGRHVGAASSSDAR